MEGVFFVVVGRGVGVFLVCCCCQVCLAKCKEPNKEVPCNRTNK